GPPGRGGRGDPGAPPRDGRPQLMVIAAIVLSAVAAGAVAALVMVRSPGAHSGSTAAASASSPGQAAMGDAVASQADGGQPTTGPAGTTCPPTARTSCNQQCANQSRSTPPAFPSSWWARTPPGLGGVLWPTTMICGRRLWDLCGYWCGRQATVVIVDRNRRKAGTPNVKTRAVFTRSRAPAFA